MSKQLTITLDQQIVEARRELAMRRRLYPKWVDEDRLNLVAAQLQLASQEAILTTLKNIQDFTINRGDLEKIQTITVEL